MSTAGGHRSVTAAARGVASVTIAAVLSLAVSAAWAQTAKPVVMSKGSAVNVRQFKIAPQSLRDLEKRFDGRLESLVPDANEPVDVLGPTRGIYVDGCCVVFTVVVNLVRAQELSPFLREIPKEIAERVHKRRVERLPILKKAMDEMLHVMAMTYAPQVPPDQEMVLAVRLYYASWESTAGMPAQIMMRATRAGVQTGDIKTEEQ